MQKYLKPIIFFCLFAVPFVPFLVSSSLFFPFITTKAFAFRILIEIAFAAWGVLAWSAPEYRPKKSLILYAMLAFLAVIGLADAFGVAPLKSFWSNYERMEGFVALLHLAAFFIVSGSVFREMDWKHWWNTSLLASFFMVIYSGFQLAGTIQIHQGGARVDGTLGNASYLAVYMLFHIFIALLFLYRTKKEATLRYMYGLLILLQVWILYHTATRGAILGLVGGLFIAALLNVRNREEAFIRKASVSLIGLILVLTGGFFLLRNTSFVQNSLVLSRFASISTEELKSGGRSFVWPMALKGIAERPILGWGQDNFNYVFNEHYSPKMYNLEPWFDRAHNIFLDWGVAGGLLGLLAYLSLYGVSLWAIWQKREGSFTYGEKTILTALLAAYFFHNFFVFDQLVSYFLFMALLGYLHYRSATPLLSTQREVPKNNLLALSGAAVLLVLALYFVNVKPLRANADLIGALSATQNQHFAQAVTDFETSYKLSFLGRSEAVEQISSAAPAILASSLPLEERNSFYQFAAEAVTKEASTTPGDARHEMVAGLFFTQTGAMDEAIKHLKHALSLMPGKQAIYFELGSTLINKGDTQGALAIFKQGVDLDPTYLEAKRMYLIASIYAHDTNLEYSLLAQLPEKEVIFDDRVISAYYAVKRFAAMRAVLERRKQLDPANAATYDNYLKQVDALK